MTNPLWLIQDFFFRLNFEPPERQLTRFFPALGIERAVIFTQPDQSRVWGVDESGRWAGIVDFSVTKAAGASFAFIKAMDGTVPTPYYKENAQSAKVAGLLYAPYHWLYPNWAVSCKLQAQKLFEFTRDYPGDLPMMLDFEWTRYASGEANPNYSDLRAFTGEWNRIAGRKPILYSSWGYCDQFGTMPPDLRNMFAGLCVANYGVSVPLLPGGWEEWLFWQFSASGDALELAPGTTGKRELDLQYFIGGLNELRALANLPATEEPPTDDGGDTTMDTYRVIWERGCNTRPEPNTNNTYITVLPFGTEFDVIGYFIPEGKLAEQEIWGELANGQWVALVYAGSVRAEEVTGEPAEPPAEVTPPDWIEAHWVNGTVKKYVPE